MKRPTTITALIIAAGLILSAPLPAAKDRKDIKMRFYVDDGKLKLNESGFWTTRSNCERKDHPGCYYFASNWYGDFTLTLKNGDRDCRSDDHWRFHPTEAVTLGGEAPIGEPLEKHEVVWGNISDQASADFDADKETGVVNVNTDRSDKKVSFKSLNDGTRPYSIWYKVTVASCREDEDGMPLETLVFDPRVDNRGNSGL